MEKGVKTELDDIVEKTKAERSGCLLSYVDIQELGLDFNSNDRPPLILPYNFKFRHVPAL